MSSVQGLAPVTASTTEPSARKARPGGADEMDGVGGLSAASTLWIVDDLQHAEQAQRGKPAGHDRAEEQAHRAGAAFLDEKQAGQDGQRQRNHIGLQGRRHQPRPFDGESTEMAGVIMLSP